MSISALQSYIFTAKCARYKPDLKRREVLSEAFARTIGMHRTKYADFDIEDELNFAEAAMNDGIVLGSQRAMQFGGVDILKKEARIYNCTTSYINRPSFFQQCFWLLLCGCGTGFSVQKHHVAKLPNIQSRPKDKKVYKIQDTIEGWADALGVLLASFGFVDDHMGEFDKTDPRYQPEGTFSDYVGHVVEFDYSQIRPAGSQLSSGNGTAPGPDPLRNELHNIEKLINRCLKDGQDRLKPIDAYDIVMFAAEAVLAGGVRRSATICLFSHDDEEMMNAKTCTWMGENPQRSKSNNSVVLLRDSTSKEDFMDILNSVRQYGEPGFVWADDTEITYNPCVEIGLYPQITNKEIRELGGMVDGPDEQPQYGWAFCNLCEINAAACLDEETWMRAAKAASILGTLQAGYTDFKYLGKNSSYIAQREALLGVSMTGIQDNPTMALDPEKQRIRAQHILDVNKELAAKINIRPTARATCVKPAGTTSCILGTASGIHPHHSDRYFRRVQANRSELPAKFFTEHNPHAVETSIWKPESDVVITFLIEPQNANGKVNTKQVLSGIDLLKHVRSTQENWVMGGCVKDRCSQPWLRHNVSNTINLRDDEWETAAEYIYDNREFFAGISLLSHYGDLDYPQAPNCHVRTAEELVERYGNAAIVASGLIVDGLHAFGQDLWLATDTAMGVGRAEDLSDPNIPVGAPDAIRQGYELSYEQKVDWVRRFKQFAKHHFGYNAENHAMVKESIQEATKDGKHLESADIRDLHQQMTKLDFEWQEKLHKCAYCLKDAHNFWLWQKLERSWKEVDYTQLIEEEDNTNMMADGGCKGAACDIMVDTAETVTQK